MAGQVDIMKVGKKITYALVLFAVAAFKVQAKVLVSDTFSWGAGVSNRTSVTLGTTISNKVPERGVSGTTWNVTSGTAVFGGVAGYGNGLLTLGGNSAVTVSNTPAGMVTAVMKWVVPSGSNSACMGWQVATPSTNLLVNQTTDKIYCRVSGAGVIDLAGRIGTNTVSTQTNIVLTGSEMQVSLTLNIDQKTADVDVQIPASGVSAATSVSWVNITNTPVWSRFAINSGSTGTVYRCDVGQLIKLPEAFPIVMGFKSLMSAATDPNYYFDTLQNCGLFAAHHGAVSDMDSIKTAYSNVITIAMNPRWVDGENRSQNSTSANTGSVWPGFWAYKTGSLITSNLSASSTTIAVASTNLFNLPPDGDMVIIYARQTNNTPNWNYYEYAQVTNIVAGAIQVKRGCTGTTAKSFTNGQAVVAHVISAWVTGPGDMLFKQNLSLYCPRNPATGENAFEFWARGEAAALNAGLNDGAEHDVVYCVLPPDADADNDLQPDGGFKDGVNLWNLGYQENVKLIREAVGPDKIMQYDCVRARSGYRGWKYVNGIQMETFGGGEHFSENFDTLSQWAEKAEAKPAFSYGFCKQPTTTYGGVTPDHDWMFRKQLAAGLMVGMPHPYAMGISFGIYDWDEQRGGNLSNYTWLGKATGFAQRDFIGLGTDMLSSNSNWTVLTDTGYTSTNIGTVYSTNGIQISVTGFPAGAPDSSAVRLDYADAQIQLITNHEYTLTFDAKADDTFVYGGKVYPDIPRYIEINNYGTIPGMGVLVTREWRTYRLSFVTGANAKFTPDFDVSETIGSVWIRSISLQEGTADRLSREFESGKVFLNESQEKNWTVNLGTNQYWRIRGNIRPDVNNGRKVSGSITVPSRDAVYLLKRDPMSGVAGYYDLTVTGGNGGGSYTNGEVANIAADAPVPGNMFDRWTGDTQYVAGVSSSNTTLIMPSNNVIVTAIYTPIPDSSSDRWENDVSGNWTDSTNWTNGNVPGIPGGSNSANTATFDVTLTTNRTVTVDTDRNIAGIAFGNTGTNAYTLTGGAIKLSNGGVIQTLAGTGNHNDAVASPITIMGNGGSATIRNDAAGNTAGLLITGTVSGNSTAGSTTTFYLDGVSTTTSRNNITAGISDGATGGNLKVVKNGPGLWQLNFVSTTSTFTGGFYFNAGTIRFYGNYIGGFGTGTITIGTNVTFNHANSTSFSVITNAMVANGDFTMSGGNGVEFRGPLNLAGGIRKVTQSSGTNTVFSGVISNGGLLKAGTDPLTLSGNNTYSGGTTVSNGALIGMSNGSLGISNVTVLGGATLTLSASNCLGDQASLILATNATLNLTFSGTDMVSRISLNSGSSWLPYGSYTDTQLGALGSGTYSGSGILLVEGFANDPAHTPYSWLAQYGLTNFNADAMADADRDGLLTWQEYIAGTNPTNAASNLRITGGSATVQGTVIRWSSASNKIYNLSRTTNLLQSFAAVAGATNLTATPPQNVYTNPTQDGGSAFYRISVY